MEMNIYRRKLLNAILFFAENTQHTFKTKMAKLLYFFDFIHFQQTGYPSIGLKYYACENGPLPISFWIEIQDGIVPEDFSEQLDLVKRTDLKYEAIEFIAKTSPNLDVFTPHEITILTNLAEQYNTTNAAEISQISHHEDQPWHFTYHTFGPNAQIDYMLALENDTNETKKELSESLKSYFEIMKNFHIYPTTQ